MPDGTEDATMLRLEAAARDESVDLVHGLIEELWSSRPGVGMIDRIRFETAVIEVLDNVVEHAYALDGEADGRRFDITLRADDAELVATIGDNGRPCEIDLSQVAMPGEDAESGRGLALAKSTLDELEYERENSINHWRLTCRRQA